MPDQTTSIQSHLDRAQAEGGSLAAYAKRHNLDPQQLYYYRRQARSEHTDKSMNHSASSAFVKVDTQHPSLTAIQLPNGISIQATTTDLVGLLPTLFRL